MLTTIRAIYESDGVLRLPGPLPLNAGQEVEVTLNVPTGGAGRRSIWRRWLSMAARRIWLTNTITTCMVRRNKVLSMTARTCTDHHFQQAGFTNLLTLP